VAGRWVPNRPFVHAPDRRSRQGDAAALPIDGPVPLMLSDVMAGRDPAMAAIAEQRG
jgi:hypothetical protein